MRTIASPLSPIDRTSVHVVRSPRGLPVRLQEFLIKLSDQLAAWEDRRAARRRLLSLDERHLHDIGIDRTQALAEANKPFWRP